MTFILPIIFKRSLLYLSIAFLFSCAKSENSNPAVVPPVVVEKDPAQYGTPFKSVPSGQDATIYQVNMRVFSPNGDFKGVVARLDSIKALGANVIYLMPIHPVGVLKGVNSPYCIKDYKGINAEFGNIDDLRAIVDGAHNRNMAVIMDWVGNHTAYDNAWTSNKSWYLQDNGGNIVSPPNTGWNDVAQLNFDNKEMRLAMIKAMKYWVFTANIDGYRCDYTDGPPLDFWKQALDTLKNISTHKFLMLAEGSRTTNLNQGFDLNFGFNFFDKMKSVYGKSQAATLIDDVNFQEYNGVATGKQVVRYTTNHDVNGAEGTPQELFGGEKGALGAFVIAAYMNGTPMIYNGQEVAFPTRLTFPFTSTKINWSINPATTAVYKKIIALRNNSDALKKGTLTSFTNTDVCAFTKELGTEKLLVICNVRNSNIDFKIPTALVNSKWTDALNGGNLTVSDKITLQPYSYLVLKN